MASRMNDTGARRQQILEHATALFALKGYHGVGIDEIADACGVVRGTVLKYFNSKQELYRQVLYNRGNPARDYLIAVCEDESIPVAKALDKLAEILGQQFESNRIYLGKDLENTEYLQNFDVLRLPAFRDQQQYLEKLILRGNKEGVFHVGNPHMRAFSILFAIFWQSTVLLEIMNLFDCFVIDELWVKHGKTWIIEGTEDLAADYIPAGSQLRKRIAAAALFALYAAVFAGIVSRL